jgi:branched-chain amino acid transport system permease protein
VNLIKILLIPLILIVLAFAPYFMGTTYRLSILQDVLLWVGLSISWYSFSGLTKYISLGSVAFVGTGMYFTGIYLNLSYFRGYYPILPWPVVLLLAGLINFTLALAIGSVTLRLKGIYFAIVTFGAGEVVSGIIRWWQTKAEVYDVALPKDLTNSPQIVYFSILITVLAVLLLTTLLRRSKFGLALRMIGESEDAAAHVGVNTSLFKILGFAICAMCMGFIGGSYAIRYPSVNITTAFQFNYSFLPAVMTMLGGIGTVFGPMIGATALSLLSEYLRVTFTYYFLIFEGVVVIVIVLFMPNGIMGVLQGLRGRLMGRKELAKAPKKPP